MEDTAAAPFVPPAGLRYELRDCPDGRGGQIDGLRVAWITLDRPEALNAYTTEMLEGLTGAAQHAGADPSVVAVVLTGAGARSFCTGGDAKHYAEDFAGRPEAFRTYLRIFADSITALLRCPKPVINRVNGLRLAGGQELGLACDLSLSSDMARFGQAGPRVGSAPIMGSTDLLPLYVGYERASLSCTLTQPWSAYEAQRFGLLSEVIPVLRIDGEFVPNPLVVTDRWLDERGQIVHGTARVGDDLAAGKARLKSGEIDLAPLDEAVDRAVASMADTFPGCLTKTLEALRTHKLDRWETAKDGHIHWLALNMMTEANAGFRAFARGTKERRTADHRLLRQRLAEGAAWDEALIEEILP